MEKPAGFFAFHSFENVVDDTFATHAFDCVVWFGGFLFSSSNQNSFDDVMGSSIYLARNQISNSSINGSI